MTKGELKTTEDRSELMRRVRQKDTRPERAVRQLLWSTGARYRINVDDLLGTPDIANKAKAKAIFVHGCYWHHHDGCSQATVPRRNRDFWLEKFHKNRERDQRMEKDLREQGFDVLVVWACELNALDDLRDRLKALWFCAEH